MSRSDAAPSPVASSLAEPLAVVTLWLVVFVVADVLAPPLLSDVVVAGVAGGVAFATSQRYLRARQKQ